MTTCSMPRSSRVERRCAHSLAAAGEAMTTMRSPSSKRSRPPGMITRSPRMMEASTDSAGTSASATVLPTSAAAVLGVQHELDHLDAAAGEDVGLQRGRHADGARDGLGDLDLGRDHEVDVELPLAPGLQVLGALRAGDDAAAAQRAGLQRGDDVDLVAVRGRDHEVGAADAGAHEHGARGAVPLHRQDVVAVAERVEAGRVEIDHRDVVLLVQRLDHGGPDLPRADHQDSHRAEDGRRRGRACHARVMLAARLDASKSHPTCLVSADAGTAP